MQVKQHQATHCLTVFFIKTEQTFGASLRISFPKNAILQSFSQLSLRSTERYHFPALSSQINGGCQADSRVGPRNQRCSWRSPHWFVEIPRSSQCLASERWWETPRCVSNQSALQLFLSVLNWSKGSVCRMLNFETSRNHIKNPQNQLKQKYSTASLRLQCIEEGCRLSTFVNDKGVWTAHVATLAASGNYTDILPKKN